MVHEACPHHLLPSIGGRTKKRLQAQGKVGLNYSLSAIVWAFLVVAASGPYNSRSAGLSPCDFTIETSCLAMNRKQIWAILPFCHSINLHIRILGNRERESVEIYTHAYPLFVCIHFLCLCLLSPLFCLKMEGETKSHRAKPCCLRDSFLARY